MIFIRKEERKVLEAVCSVNGARARMVGWFDTPVPLSLNFLSSVLIFQPEQSVSSYELLFCPLHLPQEQCAIGIQIHFQQFCKLHIKPKVQNRQW